MGNRICGLVVAVLLVVSPCGLCPALCDEILFQDDFKGELSKKWQIVGLTEQDYRLRDGGLEMRVKPGKWDRNMPALNVIVPLADHDTVIVSVKVAVLDQFTQDGEFAGVHLLDEDGSIFKATKERKDGKLVYTPGEVEFVGKEGQENDSSKYKTLLVDESPEAGPLRIMADHGYAFFQVGPSTKGKYHNHFYCAIRNKPTRRGFGLIATGAPEGATHWVQFENFRVFKQ